VVFTLERIIKERFVVDLEDGTADMAQSHSLANIIPYERTVYPPIIIQQADSVDAEIEAGVSFIMDTRLGGE